MTVMVAYVYIQCLHVATLSSGHCTRYNNDHAMVLISVPWWTHWSSNQEC